MRSFMQERVKLNLFLCVENEESQMAEGFFNKYTPKE
jgi:hypothetical protein